MRKLGSGCDLFLSALTIHVAQHTSRTSRRGLKKKSLEVYIKELELFLLAPDEQDVDIRHQNSSTHSVGRRE